MSTLKAAEPTLNRTDTGSAGGLPGAGGLLAVVRSGLSIVGPDTPRLVAVMVVAFIVGAIETLLLYIVASVASAMSGGTATVPLGPSSLGYHVALMTACQAGLALTLVLLLLSWPLSGLMASLSTRSMIRLRSRMIQSYLKSSLQYRQTQREGLLQQLVSEYSLRAETSVQHLTLAGVAVAMLATVLMGAVASAPVMALVMLATIFLAWLLLAPVLKRLRQEATAPARINREIDGRVAQTARMSQEIAAYDVGDPVSEGLAKEVTRAAIATGKLRFETRLGPNLFQYGAVGLVLLFVAILASFDPRHLAGLAPLTLLLVRSLTYIRQLQRSFHAAREMAPYIGAINRELEALEHHRDAPGTRTADAWSRIAFTAVDYSYKPGMPVLRGIDFAIEPGEFIGIVGPSGSGKSTLTDLLLRVRLPTAGTITVGDVPLSDVSAECWAGAVAYVPQESRLLYGTVADNIRMFRPGHTPSEVEDAARAAGVADEIAALPQGYDTLVGPGARGLSGGQMQRISIARALLGSPRILVMDEPTSALDARSETVIGQTLSALKGKVTILFIAHRPATLSLCDRILELRQGRLTELPAGKAAHEGLAVLSPGPAS